MLCVIDFEVTKYDWLCCIYEPYTDKMINIVNDQQLLREYYESNTDRIYVGYNISGYDRWIFAGILLGYDPKKINDWIIKCKKYGGSFSKDLYDLHLVTYDCTVMGRSLKQLEAFMGLDIVETEVDFDIDRRLTEEEIVRMVKYCENDVRATAEVLVETQSIFNANLDLIIDFKLPLSSLGKTRASLVQDILGCQRHTYNDEWEYTINDNIELGKYDFIKQWFTENKDYSKKLKTDIDDVPHIFSWGGAHGAKLKYHAVSGDRILVHVDVDGYYPALMIEYDLLSRSIIDKPKFKQIRDHRLELKLIKDEKQASYKIVVNGTYGISKQKTGKAYDPRRANEVCVNGQLYLVDLIEKLEHIPDFELIQSNTDGLIVSIPNTDEAWEALDDACFEWETRTRMTLAFDHIDEIWERDVNNYIYREVGGKIVRRGSWCKEKSPIDNDCPILTDALIAAIVDGVNIREYIENCDDFQKFQIVYKVSNKFDHAEYGNVRKSVKVFRVFADANGDILYSVRSDNSRKKFSNCPKCRIFNGKVKDEKCPEWLDREWYIKEVERRYEQFL